ncbi:zinc finger HIT domain-containing protein 1-like [Sycon ciliatum]|uniref:zinc finger HIT domain-containing protein 1-like n=1 Tax=Sycon ciliatum TaxID=27933 RepID=UPI0020AA8AA6|eukprot:scpid77495/ scgid8627/ Zinc finger HIT domain-containing protein 1; Cyclin-G1-binding protein 1; Zinc finger protein subfamily 4A member 1; p18 Hamlet &gt; Zinc finger HIT domain-containing protein 1
MEDLSSGGSRHSARVKDNEVRRVLDDATRSRRQRRQLESLERDNFHEDPHSQFVQKKLPSFSDGETPSKSKKRQRASSQFKMKVRKNFAGLLEDVQAQYQQQPQPGEGERKKPTYFTAAAPSPRLPKRRFCSVCGFPSTYTCPSCGARYCSSRCQKTHQDTRCLKWTA